MPYNILRNIDEISLEQWFVLLDKSSLATVFQTPQFFNYWATLANYTPELIAIEDNGVLKALVVITHTKESGLRGNFAKRTIIYGGPVFDTTSPDWKPVLKLLLQEIIKASSQNSIYTEIRNYSSYADCSDLFRACGWQFIPYLNFHVDCTDVKQVEARMSSSKRRQIRQSQKAGAKIFEAQDEKHILSFYHLVAELYKNKVKRPLPGIDFFVNFQKVNLGKYFLIEYQNKVIGGIMCPILVNRCIYEWYVVGEDGKYKNVYPSILATWAAIEYAVKNNIPRFDFMGAGQKDQDYGVREFKSRFGGELVNYGRYVKIKRPFIFFLGKFGLKIIEKLR